MTPIARQFRDFFVSLKLTVVLLALSIILIFWATLAQVNLGIWGVQQKFFHSLIVVTTIGQDVSPGMFFSVATTIAAIALGVRSIFRNSPTVFGLLSGYVFALYAFVAIAPLLLHIVSRNPVPAPVFPGGYFIGGLLLINLVAAHVYRLKFEWRKIGIQLTHAGLILLLVGELLSSLLQVETQMRIEEGATTRYSESNRLVELVLVDTTDPKFDEVVAIPEAVLGDGGVIQHPKLPFQLKIRDYYPNADVRMRDQVPNAAPALATAGLGPRAAVIPLPLTHREGERNAPAANIELVAPEGSLGTWMVSLLVGMPQKIDYQGRSWVIALRAKRTYFPFSITLHDFTHDVYPGTDIPKNFSSRIQLKTDDGHDDREVLIYMNNPLRHAGLTFYQASFEPGDKVTILQVVRNPGWVLPYVACVMMGLGLIIQFTISLVTRRSGGRAARVQLTGFARWLPFLALLLAAGWLVSALRTPANETDVDLNAFGRVPILVNGRIKPLDTVARTSLLVLQGRQRVSDPTNPVPFVATPTQWLADLLFDPEKADTYPTFRISATDSPELLTLMGLTEEQTKIRYESGVLRVLSLADFVPSTRTRFSFNQLADKLSELDRQAQLAEPINPQLRTPFQRAVIQLRDRILLYQRLKHSLQPPDSPDFVSELVRFKQDLPAGVAAFRAQQKKEAYDEAAFNSIINAAQRFDAMGQLGYLLAIPPDAAEKNPAAWRSAGAALLESFSSSEINPNVMAYAALGHAWRKNDAKQFNEIVGLYREQLAKRYAPQLHKGDIEARFNATEPFYKSMQLYAVAFFVAVFSWLLWPEVLGRIAFNLVLLAFIAATAGIAARMWLEGRPPVTNLYSSALFIGWGAVGLCLILERIYRNGIGSVAAGMVGFCTLLIAHHLSLDPALTPSGDTMEMMRAVLDTNLWLATHVVVVTSGYAATFLAGFLALLYILLGVFTPWLQKTASRESAVAITAAALSSQLTASAIVSAERGETNAKMIERMVYGIVCFATLCSLVGTVLGGIWADQSWGRFWGWDPKENGALMIVLWNAIILHARWGGLVKQRGLMCLAIFGNIITSWSWFGTNMLGVGLHSYGFMDAAFWWLIGFVASQLAIIGLALMPLESWRSFRTKAA